MPCTKGMPVRVDNRPGTGCRADCLHRALVREYRDVRATAAEARRVDRDLVANGYVTEGKAYDLEHGPVPALREFLTDRARRVDSSEQDL